MYNPIIKEEEKMAVDRYSRQQNFCLELINATECMSVVEMEYILYNMFNCTIGQAELVIHSLVYDRRVHVDKDFQWMAVGAKGTANARPLNRDTVKSIAVALEIIEKNDDYRYLYKPNTGSDLMFVANQNIYEVLNVDPQSKKSLERIAYFNKIQSDKLQTIAKKKDAETAYLAAVHYLITFPARTNVNSACKRLKELDLVMPYSVVILQEENIFNRVNIEIYDPEDND